MQAGLSYGDCRQSLSSERPIVPGDVLQVEAVLLRALVATRSRVQCVSARLEGNVVAEALIMFALIKPEPVDITELILT